ncbi:MAG: hypothetical protein M0D57_20610 [Sphingobacteriales bacterium JAD_PAG50586_3]|nr:MAG: hypothetical protein M0D57_20610 [Sphingobacteriales bacterium JAD_PAG50586_3]
MIKTAEILSKPKNYIPLAIFTLWVFANALADSRPFFDILLPFVLIAICVALYKIKIGLGKMATGLLLLAYTFNLFQISDATVVHNYSFAINGHGISTSNIKPIGLLFIFIYLIFYFEDIAPYIRKFVWFMINPNEKN